MRISYKTTTSSLGPGKRYVIWVQGCLKRCKGCINPEGWDLNAGYDISLEEIQNDLIQNPQLTGITVSGGEPMLQHKELRELFAWIRENTDLDIMLYSGYTYDEICLEFGDEGKQTVQMTDIFIDGEYEAQNNNNSIYRGSDNQKIYFFSSKYMEREKDILSDHNRKFAFELNSNGDVFFVGIPPAGFYEKFLEELGGLQL